MRLPDYIAALPLTHLQLRKPAATLASQYQTIGDLLAARRSIRPKPGYHYRAGHDELKSALRDLKRSCDNAGRVNWKRYRKLRFRGREHAAVGLYFASEQLDALSAQEKSKPIAALKIAGRANGGLRKAGINTVGGLIAEARRGRQKTSRISNCCVGDVINSLETLERSLRDRGRVDWSRYLELRGLSLYPSSCDRYEIILREAGRPLHYEEIFKRSKNRSRRGTKAQTRTTRVRLSGDPRFEQSQRAGFWRLKEWGSCNREDTLEEPAGFCPLRLGDYLELTLRDAGRPLHYLEIIARSKFRRKGAIRSIRNRLSLDPRFKPAIKAGVWALAKWEKENAI